MKRVLTIRMGSLLTALAILFSLFPIPVAAVEAGWIDHAQMPEDYAEDASTVTINSAEELAWLAKTVNAGTTFQGKTIELTSNIDLVGSQWVPIGTKSHPFQGTLDGNGAVISGMQVSSDSGGLAGFFGYVQDAEIYDLELSSAVLTAQQTGIQRAGLLAGWVVGSTVSGVTVRDSSMEVTISGAAQFSSFGGLVGLVDFSESSGGSSSEISGCKATGITISYAGSADTSAAYTIDLGGWDGSAEFYLPVSLGGLVGAQGNPYHDKYRGAYGYPTSMDHCKAEDLTVTRTAGDGSLLEAIGGMIGSVQTAASVEDCSVEDLVADLTAEIPSTSLSDAILAGLYLGGVAGIFDGDSTMLRCSVIHGEVDSSVTGGHTDDSKNSGGFYGGLAGMLGASPGKTSDTRNPQHNHGLGSTLKACYSEIHFEVTAEESVRYVSSVRALNGTSSAIISITDTFCDITDITAEPTSPGNAYYPVYGYGYGVLSNAKNMQVSQLHPAAANTLYVGEAREPLSYTYHQVTNSSDSKVYASMGTSNAGNGFDLVTDLVRTYTYDTSVPAQGYGTDRLIFTEAGTYPITVEITNPDDPDSVVQFTKTVTVTPAPTSPEADSSAEILHQINSGDWHGSDTQDHILPSADEAVSIGYTITFDLLEVASMYEDASGDLWYSGEDFAYDFASPYDSFHDTTLTLAFTFDEGFQPSSEPITDQLSLESEILQPQWYAYTSDNNTLYIVCDVLADGGSPQTYEISLTGLTGTLSDSARAALRSSGRVNLKTTVQASGFLLGNDLEYAPTLHFKSQSEALCTFHVEGPQTWTVSYNLNGGTGDPNAYKAVSVMDGGTVAVAPAPIRSGYTFAGWSDGTILYQPGDALTVTGNLTLTAAWTENASPTPTPDPGDDSDQTPYLRFNSNGGTKFAPIEETDAFRINPYDDAEYGVHIPTRPGYCFTGWYRDSFLTRRVDEEESLLVNGYLTLFAGWEESIVPAMLNGSDHFAYIQGYADGTVRPNASITRAQVATIFFRLLDEGVRQDFLTTTHNFSDVAANDWANTAIATMSALGIIQGRSDGSFDPDAPITRAEFAAICARFASGGGTGGSAFTDISGHWAKAEIERAAALGWVWGFADGTFRPDAKITRAQAITMINRILNRLPEDKDDLLPGMNTWSDCRETDWYYLAIQEATNSHAFQPRDQIHERWTALTSTPDWSRYESTSV